MRLSSAMFLGLFTTSVLLFPQAESTAQSAVPGSSDASAYRTNPKWQQAVHAAQAELRTHQFEFAKGDFAKANKIAGGQCWGCLDGMESAAMHEGDYKGAIDAAEKMKAMAEPGVAKSLADFKLGDAILAKAGEKPKPEQLEEAHEAFQQALTEYPKNLPAMFRDGETLTRMGKIDAAKTCFSQCAAMARASDPARLRAQHFAEDPTLSLKRRAPAFEVTAMDGTRFNLDAMGGRVVLIDFWATWCGPCNAALPEVKRIAKDFAGEPLVILSVSWDSDEDKWKQFVAKNEMTWLQYRDADHALGNAFGINSIPHYFTIDSDGVLTAEMVGSDSDVEGRLKKLVAKARDAQKQRLEAAAAASGGR
jgi:thiol-disulfide isomerase/thioredoxin